MTAPARNRPSAKEAIEGLKIHQLRKENTIIFDEIKGLRSDVTNRQQELNTVQSQLNALQGQSKDLKAQVKELQSQLKEAHDSIRKDHQKSDNVNAIFESIRAELKTLRESFQTDSIGMRKRIGDQEAASKTQAMKADEIMTALDRLTEKLNTVEELHADELDTFRGELLTRAGNDDILEIQARFDAMLRDLDGRFDALDTVSRVTDTFPRPDNSTPRNEFDLLSLWSDPPVPRAGEGEPVTPLGGDQIHERTSSRDQTPRSPDWSTAEPSPLSLKKPFVPRLQQPRRVSAGNVLPQILKDAQPTKAFVAQNLARRKDKGSPQEHFPLQVAQTRQQHERSALLPSPIPQGQTPMTKPQPVGKALNMLLRAKQGHEGLSSYFENLKAIVALLPSDAEIIAICLRRFLNGITENVDKEYMTQWLRTSQYTIQNAHDCIFLLTRCLGVETQGLGQLMPRSIAQNCSSHSDQLNCEDDEEIPLPCNLGVAIGTGSDDQVVLPTSNPPEAEKSQNDEKKDGHKRQILHLVTRPNVTTRAAWAAVTKSTLEDNGPPGTRKDQNDCIRDAARKPGKVKSRPNTQRKAPTRNAVRKGGKQRPKKLKATDTLPAETSGMDVLQGNMRDEEHGIDDPDIRHPAVISAQNADEEASLFDIPIDDKIDDFPSSPPLRQPVTTYVRKRKSSIKKITAPVCVNATENTRVLVQEASESLQLPPVRTPKRPCPSALDGRGRKKRICRYRSSISLPSLALTESDFEECKK